MKLTLTKKQYLLATIVVLFLAFVLRFYKLGVVPHGMTWDEAAIGYNGFSILTTRRDEWLTKLPFSFWSFGDYKAPLAIYLNGFFTFVLGMNLFAVRFPFAVAAVLAVWGMMRLTKLLTKSRFWAVVAGFLLTLSPWHLHFSRAGFESGLALTLVIWGSYFFFKALVVNKDWRARVDFFLAVSLFVASVYAYHSAKIFTPLLVLGLVMLNWREVWKKSGAFLLSSLAGVLMLGPFVYDAVYGKGLERAGTLIFSQGLSWLKTLEVLWGNLLAHLSPSFLVLGETTSMRHSDGKWGVLLLTTFVLVLASFLNKNKHKLFNLSLLWVFLGLLPAVLGTQVPHSNRALLALPGLILLAVIGLETVLALTKDRVWKKAVFGSLIILHLFLFISYLSNYYTDFDQNSSEDFQDVYLEAFNYVIPYEKGADGKHEVERIIFTTDYGQPYIYALFSRKTNPINYHGGSLIKYEFKEEISLGDLERNNTIVVASSTDELYSKNDKADHVIYGRNGEVRFRIYFTPGAKQ